MGASSTAYAAALTYDALAQDYDVLTADYAYAAWVRRLVELARRHGLPGRRALDAACGTGSAALELHRLGFAVEAFDVSPRMAAAARRKVEPLGIPVRVADMRHLDETPRFDLVTCLDDAVDYLTTDADLRAAMSGFAGAVRAGGLVVFDVNSRRTYETDYAATTVERDARRVVVRAGDGRLGGGRFGMTIELFAEASEGLWRRSSTRHVQRHHTAQDIARGAGEAGLTVVGRHGQRSGARIAPDADERRDDKIVYVLRRDSGREGVGMHIRP